MTAMSVLSCSKAARDLLKSCAFVMGHSVSRATVRTFHRSQHCAHSLLYRAIDSSGALVDVMFSERRDMAAAKGFFRSAKRVTGITPDRITTDGHDSYPRAIRTELGKRVRHRTSQYMNNRIEQDHRGIKGRYRAMRGFKCPRSAARFCRGHDELRDFLRPQSRHNQHVPANHR
jgi:transposase-like protein